MFLLFGEVGVGVLGSLLLMLMLMLCCFDRTLENEQARLRARERERERGVVGDEVSEDGGRIVEI